MLLLLQVLILVTGVRISLCLGHVNAVLIGATGDLSRKYLWRSLAEVSRETPELRIFGGSRAETEVGAGIIEEILETVADGDEEFAKKVKYVQLAKCEDYEKLCGALNEGTAFENENGYCIQGEKFDCQQPDNEEGRLFYLSIPPFTYPEVIDCISRHCKPQNGSATWLRIALEKPFGHDLTSVKSLIGKLRANFNDDQLYPVDHYLGKAAVRAIYPFRIANKEWLEPLLNADHVDRVEIFAAEEDDVKGRVNYYDRYGALLDMVQNHLMEVFQSIAADLPYDSVTTDRILEEKSRVLRSVNRVQPDDIFLGQHEAYRGYAKEELKDPRWKGRTNTLAAVRLSVSSGRWATVPFVLFAGKAMPFRTAYAKIIFNLGAVCIGGPKKCSTGKIIGPAELIFEINHEGQGKPSIRVAKDYFSNEVINVPESWELSKVKDKTARVYEYTRSDNPYALLISDAVNGKRENFVPIENLMDSWGIWEDVLKGLSEMEVQRYPENDIEGIALMAHGIGLLGYPKDDLRRSTRPKRFSLESRGEGIALSAAQLYDRLARDFLDTAREAISSRGVFHAAVPGGSTPIPMYKMIRSVALQEGFTKWSSIHLWFTDERCVLYDSPESNLKTVSDSLLSKVPIPVTNVHPMPVLLAKGFCEPDDHGNVAYERALKESVRGLRLDYVLLGVGADGHVASIFPGGEKHGKGSSVVLTQGPESRRMSLTLEAVNTARHVVIAVVGEGKRDVMGKICGREKMSAEDLPVLGVKPKKALRWFVDDEAFEGSGCDG